MDCREQQTLVLEKLAAMEVALQETVDLLRTVVTLLEHRPGPQPTAPEAPQPKIATYEEMYGPVEPAPEPVWVRTPLPGSLGCLRRWLYKE